MAMRTFNGKVHEFVVARECKDRAPAVNKLNVIEMDSKLRRRPKHPIPSVASQDQQVAETAAALAEFVVGAQMQGFGMDRNAAIESLRCALEALPFKVD
jgi:hypothetical protein